jgi:hypothetical protein
VEVTTTSDKGPSGLGEGARLPPRVHHAPAPGRKRGHQTSPRERQAVVAVAVAAAIGGAFSAASPTNYLLTDVLLRAGIAALISLAASRARRWTWLVLAGIAVVGAPAGWWFAVTAAGLLFAVATTIFARRRIYGAIVGALAAQGLLRFTDVAFGRGSAVLFAVAVVPVLASAYAVAPRRVRKRIHQSLAVGAGLMALAVVVFGVSALLAYGQTQSGARHAKAGLRSIRDGHSEEAGDELQQAATAFRSANDIVDAWWTKPAGAVPFIAQQVRAVQVVTGEGAKMSAVAAGVAGQADIQDLKYDNGRVDVGKLAALAGPLQATSTTFSGSYESIKQVRSPWLVPPLASAVNEVEDELAATLPELRLAASAASEGPALLGATTPRRYLVLFTQPAESRGLGGFVGNWAELTAVDGRLDIARSGRSGELNAAPGSESRDVTSPPAPKDYVERYGRFHPGRFFQDVTLSPDLPSVAQATAQLYPQMGGDRIDGVLTVDPYALAALLNFTGPIKIDGFDQVLTAENAAQILVKDQYLTFNATSERVDFLDQASRQTFDQLVHGSLPSPKKLADVLGPVVEQRRLMFTALDGGEDELFAQLNANGAFPKPDGGDFFQLVTQNKANNKADLYLHREVEYDTRYDPSTGNVESKMTITLRNDAPASGLPKAVIGDNDQGLPMGTNVVYLSLYTPLGLRSARDASRPVALEYQHELGWSVYSQYIDIPAGGTATLELTLFGQIDAGRSYSLRVGAQPTVNRDKVTLRLRSSSDWEIADAPVLNVDPGRGAASVVLQPPALVTVDAQFSRS